MLIFTYFAHTKKNQPRKDCQNHIIGEQKLEKIDFIPSIIEQ